MARGVSTVLDVAVCMMLVGAAVATLAMAPPTDESSEQPDADRTASRLATVTAPVGTPDHGTAHDTIAGHLATATLANATISSDPLLKTTFPESVRNETANVTDGRVFVTATWSTYPGSPLAGEVTVGSEPPSSAETATTVLEVDSGVARPKDGDSFEAIAADLAAAYLRWLFPPARTGVSLRDGRTAQATVERYRTNAEALDENVEDSIADAEVHRANAELAGELADRLQEDLQHRYESPSAAADDVTIDRVEIVVRRWEP